MPETILIVDDEEPVRRTFQGWLANSGLAVKVLVAGDSEAALLAANEHPIDLAILDWNLGTGSDGLRLLEDLVEFHPNIVAILVTGFAAQATPLEALRKGIRDYLDKSADLNEKTFLAAIRKQLESIVPAKRQRALNASLGQFAETVEKVLPLVQASAALNDPVPLTNAVRSLLRFAKQATAAADGALIVHHAGAVRAYDTDGAVRPVGEVPFHRTLAASALSRQEPSVMQDLGSLGSSVSLLPFEEHRTSVLAVPIAVSANSQVVLELFDKAFTDTDRRTASVIAEVASELLQAALAERQTHRLLADAVMKALEESRQVISTMGQSSPPSDPPPDAVLETLRSGLKTGSNPIVDADLGLDLVTAVRELAVRHGPDAVQHCVDMTRKLRKLLDSLSGG